MSLIMKSIQAARPTIPVYWPDSSKPTNAAYDALWAHPLMISERDYSGYSDDDFSSVRGTFSVNLNFNKWIKGLSADGKFDYRLNNNFVKTFNTSFQCYDYNYDTNEYITTGQFNKGLNSLNEEYKKDWLWYSMFKLNYDRIFAEKHHVTGLALVEAQASKNDNFFAYREGFISTEVDEMFAGSDENKNIAPPIFHACGTGDGAIPAHRMQRKKCGTNTGAGRRSDYSGVSVEHQPVRKLCALCSGAAAGREH